MHTRRRSLTAAAVLALVLTACTAPSENNAGTGGLLGGGQQLDPAPGDLGWGQNGTESGPMKEADTTKDAHGKTGSAFTDEVDGCHVWFGVSQARSSEYLVAADRYGIGGHVQWKCDSAAVARLRLDVKLRWAYRPEGPWTDEPAGSNANRHYSDTIGHGTAMVFNDSCTTDYWQVGFRVGVDEDMQGSVTREWVWSQWRKITSEDCARE